MELTQKQKLFVEAFVANGGNGTRAVIAAGYSSRSACEMAYENLRKPHIAEEIERRQANLIDQARKQARQQGLGRVYIVQALGMNRYKIGYTSRGLNERLAALQTGSPVEIVPVLELEGDTKMECHLHARFAQKRVHGEWFELTPLDLDWIKQRYYHLELG